MLSEEIVHGVDGPIDVFRYILERDMAGAST